MSTIPRVLLPWAVEGEAPQGRRIGGCRSFLRSWRAGGEEGTLTHKSKRTLGMTLSSWKACQVDAGQASSRPSEVTGGVCSGPQLLTAPSLAA